jgi:transposase-like protein
MTDDKKPEMSDDLALALKLDNAHCAAWGTDVRRVTEMDAIRFPAVRTNLLSFLAKARELLAPEPAAVDVGSLAKVLVPALAPHIGGCSERELAASTIPREIASVALAHVGYGQARMREALSKEQRRAVSELARLREELAQMRAAHKNAMDTHELAPEPAAVDVGSLAKVLRQRLGARFWNWEDAARLSLEHVGQRHPSASRENLNDMCAYLNARRDQLPKDCYPGQDIAKVAVLMMEHLATQLEAARQALERGAEVSGFSAQDFALSDAVHDLAEEFDVTPAEVLAAARSELQTKPKPAEPPAALPKEAPASCSFCGRERAEIKKLIASPKMGVYICGECILNAWEAVRLSDDDVRPAPAEAPPQDKPAAKQATESEPKLRRLRSWGEDVRFARVLNEGHVAFMLGHAEKDFAEELADKDKRIAELEAKLEVKPAAEPATMSVPSPADDLPMPNLVSLPQYALSAGATNAFGYVWQDAQDAVQKDIRDNVARAVEEYDRTFRQDISAALGAFGAFPKDELIRVCRRIPKDLKEKDARIAELTKQVEFMNERHRATYRELDSMATFVRSIEGQSKVLAEVYDSNVKEMQAQIAELKAQLERRTALLHQWMNAHRHEGKSWLKAHTEIELATDETTGGITT